MTPNEYDQDGELVRDTCPICNGRGTVNPLTPLPAYIEKDFFCTGTTDCPACDGSGEMP